MFNKIFKTNGPNQALAKTMTLMTSDVVGSVKLTCQSFFCADQTFDAGTHVLVGLWKILFHRRVWPSKSWELKLYNISLPVLFCFLL